MDLDRLQHSVPSCSGVASDWGNLTKRAFTGLDRLLRLCFSAVRLEFGMLRLAFGMIPRLHSWRLRLPIPVCALLSAVEDRQPSQQTNTRIGWAGGGWTIRVQAWNLDW